MSIDRYQVYRTACTMRRILAIFSALLIASLSIIVVIENRSFTTLSWGLLLIIPLALAVGIGSHGRDIPVPSDLGGPVSDVNPKKVQEQEIEPDELPVL